MLEAINACVAQRNPVYIFPVANLDNCACHGPAPGHGTMEGRVVRGGWQRGGEGGGVGGGGVSSNGEGGGLGDGDDCDFAVLRDAMMMRPGSTVLDVCFCLCHFL